MADYLGFIVNFDKSAGSRFEWKKRSLCLAKVIPLVMTENADCQERHCATNQSVLWSEDITPTQGFFCLAQVRNDWDIDQNYSMF